MSTAPGMRLRHTINQESIKTTRGTSHRNGIHLQESVLALADEQPPLPHHQQPQVQPQWWQADQVQTARQAGTPRRTAVHNARRSSSSQPTTPRTSRPGTPLLPSHQRHEAGSREGSTAAPPTAGKNSPFMPEMEAILPFLAADGACDEAILNFWKSISLMLSGQTNGSLLGTFSRGRAQ